MLILPALAPAIYCSARLAIADSYYRRDTPESIALAVATEPDDAAYHQLLAEHLESAGIDPAPEREKAALLSPLEARYWIDLGVLAEVHSDMPAAERFLLKAASVDRTFAPRWALMNFYFRQQQPPAFWQWTRAALAMAHDDVSPVFRLSRRMTNDEEFLRHLVPPSDFMRSQYLSFLIRDAHWDAAPAVARDIADRATKKDVDFLLDYCGGAMTRNSASGVNVWNLLSRRNLIPFGPLTPREGAIITNGEFRIAPWERGFDWRLSREEAVSVTLSPSGSGVSAELTGDQAQAVTLLEQWIPLDKKQNYRIDYQYTAGTDSLAAATGPSGLAWEIQDPISRAVLARSEDLKTASGTLSGHLDFTAQDAQSAVLSLTYRRVPGTVRHEEKFTIRKISSQLQADQ